MSIVGDVREGFERLSTAARIKVESILNGTAKPYEDGDLRNALVRIWHGELVPQELLEQVEIVLAAALTGTLGTLKALHQGDEEDAAAKAVQDYLDKAGAKAADRDSIRDGLNLLQTTQAEIWSRLVALLSAAKKDAEEPAAASPPDQAAEAHPDQETDQDEAHDESEDEDHPTRGRSRRRR